MVSGNRLHGFTLVELLLTLAISGILLFIALPAWQVAISAQQHSVAVNELLAAMRHARSTAIKSGSRTTLCIRQDSLTRCSQTGSWDDGWLTFIDNNSNGQRDANEQILTVHKPLSDQVSANGNRPIARYISYTPMGFTRKASGKRVRGALQMGTLSVCTGRATTGHKLVINRAGRVSKRTKKDCAPQ